MPKRKEAGEEDTYEVIAKDMYKHSKHHRAVQPPVRFYKSDTETSSAVSDVEAEASFPWKYVWLAGVLTVLFPFTVFGIVTLVLLTTAYTDYNCGMVDAYQWKIARSKTLLIVAFFFILLLTSLAVILIALASTNMLNLSQLCGQKPLLACIGLR